VATERRMPELPEIHKFARTIHENCVRTSCTFNRVVQQSGPKWPQIVSDEHSHKEFTLKAVARGKELQLSVAFTGGFGMGGSISHHWVFNHGLVRPPPPLPARLAPAGTEPLKGAAYGRHVVCVGGQVGVVSERTVGQAWSHGRVSHPERRLPEVREPHSNLGLCVHGCVMVCLTLSFSTTVGWRTK
jgi:hypothetical protein